jgi:CMP-N-acetylneuraminic acid synthetase
MVVAIVTARANSKGLPRKNMLALGGKPLIQHTFDKAIESNAFDKIVLSTDFDEVIQLAKGIPKIEIPFKRPEYLSGSAVSQIEVVNHVIDHYRTNGIYFSHIVLLQPTSPFRRIEELIEGVRLLKSGCKSVIGVSKVMHHPADYLVKDGNDKIKYLMPEYASKPRQSFPEVYFNNGALYGVEMEFYLRNQVFYDTDSIMLEMSEESLIDIDTEFEFKLAQGLLIRK